MEFLTPEQPILYKSHQVHRPAPTKNSVCSSLSFPTLDNQICSRKNFDSNEKNGCFGRKVAVKPRKKGPSAFSEVFVMENRRSHLKTDNACVFSPIRDELESPTE